MIAHSKIPPEILLKKIKEGSIILGGNKKLKIYGRLDCRSGKRMKVKNRVFFHSVEEAKKHGFRPCGNCMRAAYKKWKNEIV